MKLSASRILKLTFLCKSSKLGSCRTPPRIFDIIAPSIYASVSTFGPSRAINTLRITFTIFDMKRLMLNHGLNSLAWVSNW